jgi:polar amino acid transport system substrate-binding protein
MKRASKRIQGLFIALIGCVFPLTGQTLKIETISVAPFGFTGSDGKPTGMMFEISNRIAEEAQLNYTNEIIPYARTIFDLNIGKADFVLRFSNDELPAIAVPLVSVITMPTIILFRADSQFKSLNDLTNKIVGVVRGGKFAEDFDNNTAIHKVQVNDYAQMLRLLMRGRIDACIGSNVGLYYNAKQLGIKPEMLSLPMQLSFKEFVLHFSKKMRILKRWKN